MYDSVEIALFNIGISRAHGNRLIGHDAAHLMQIGSNQSNCRKGITTTWFNGDIYTPPKLSTDERSLFPCCGNCHRNMGRSALHLSANALNHGFPRPILPLQKTQKLLGIKIIGQRPKTLTCAARK